MLRRRGEGPIVGVVVQFGVADVGGGGGWGEHEDGRGVEDGVCGEGRGGEDAAAWMGVRVSWIFFC